MATKFLAFVVFLTLLGATPAYAERAQTTDYANDVWRLEEDASYTYVPQAPLNSDLLSVSVDHRSTDVIITATYAELAPTRIWAELLVRLHSDSGAAYAVRTDFSVKDSTGRVSIQNLAYGGPGLDCVTCTIRLSDARNLLKVRLPRAAIDDPAWFTYQASALVLLRKQQWVDDAFSKYAGSERHSHKLRAG